MKIDFGVFRIVVMFFFVIELSLEEKAERPSCKERRKLMGLENNADDYILVEASIGKEVQLECHYCNEDDDTRRIWYFRDRFFMSPPKEVILDFSHVNLDERKIAVNEHHTLIIRDFSENDGGIYFCQGYEDTNSKFNYIVDVIRDETDPFMSIKTSAQVKEFVKDKINPLNKKLSKEQPFKIGDSDEDEVHFKIILDSHPWGACKVCNRIAGIKKRLGKCELRPSKEKYHKKSADKSRSGAFSKIKFGIGFSCHSLMLEKLVSSNLAKEIRELPVIVETDNCAGECKSNYYRHKETLGKLAKEISESAPGDINIAALELDTEEPIIVQVINVTVMDFDKPFHLICPLGSDDEEIIWVKDETVIKKGKRMEVDILDRLLLKKLNFQDLGEYICTADQKQSAVLKLKLLEIHLRFTTSQLIFIWTSFSVSVLLLWCCCVTVIYFNHKRVSKGFLRRISLEDYSESEYTVLKNV